MDDIKKDARFAHVTKDPRFRKMKRKDKKVKIDKRFQAMFNDKKFKMKYQVDKRGRPIQATTNEDLRRFYDLDNSDADSEEDEGDEPIQDKEKETENTITTDKQESQDDSNSESNSDEEDEVKKDEEKEEKEEGEEEEKESGESGEDSGSDEGIDLQDGPDYARGEGLESSSSENDSSDDDEGEDQPDDEDVDHRWGELDKEAVEATEVTHRLAICNMDWDRIKAQDLMLLLNSFKPTGGFVKCVKIYPSDFGIERMKQEEVKGPIELVENKNTKKAKEADDNDEYHQERLRQYQLNRLKYYYAVAECDTPGTANTIYEQCDGIEYESSATRIDLRFIPDSMTFDEREPMSVATEVPANTAYEPSTFINTALQQSKVRLTWDETNHDRVKVTQRKFDKDEVDDMDLKDYLASDSGEEPDPYGVIEQEFDKVSSGDEDEDYKINKYKQLLQGLAKDEEKDTNDGEMEITWDPELEKKLDRKKKGKDNLTPWEDYLEKKKEKRKKKKESKKKKVDEEGPPEEEGGSDTIPSDVDMDDPYFREEIEAQKKQEEKMKKKLGKKKTKKGEKATEENSEDERKGAELELLLMDKDEDERKHFNLKDIQEREQSKGKKKKKKMKRKNTEGAEVEDSFKIDVADNRFNAVFNNPHYNIDPSAAEYKKTHAMQEMIQEKIKRRKTDGLPKKNKQTKTVDSSPGSAKDVDKDVKKDASLASLVKSVKAKTKSIQDKKQSLKNKKKH